MPKYIKIRYKDCGSQQGDPAAYNSYNMAGDFPGMKYPGQEEYIPADELDDKVKSIHYRNPDGSFEMISEKEHRARMHKYGGFKKHPKFHDAAPPALMNSKKTSLVLPPRRLSGAERAEFMKNQEFALLKFKHFNPICMEFLGETDPNFKPSQDEDVPVGSTDIHITHLDVNNSMKVIKDIEDLGLIERLIDEEIKLPQPRPEVITELERKQNGLRQQI